MATGCGDDPPPSQVEGSSGSSGSGSDGSPVTVTAAMTDGMTSNGSGDGTTTGPDETTGEPVTTGPADSSGGSSGEPGTTSGGSSSGDSGAGDGEYPPCAFDADPVCVPPYDTCYDFAMGYSVCTQPCMDDADCPSPATGDAVVTCAGPGGNQCLLDCANGETCPDGMDCVPVAGGMFNRCLWPN